LYDDDDDDDGVVCIGTYLVTFGAPTTLHKSKIKRSLK